MDQNKLQYIPLELDLDSAIEAHDFDGLARELTQWLWNTITDFPERGGLPTVDEISIDGEAPPEVFVIESRDSLEKTIRAALDGAL
jgi:hypothetical protein